MDVSKLKNKIEKSGIKASDIMGSCPSIERSQANLWIKPEYVNYSKSTYYLLEALCDVKMGVAPFSSVPVDYSAPKRESKPVDNNPVTVEQKVAEKPSIKSSPIVNTFPQQGDEDDVDLDYENMNTLDYECLSEHLPYVLAPEGKFLKQGVGVVFTHNNRGYKATPSQESPSVVFFEGQEKFKMETGFKGAIIVTKYK